VTELGRIEKIRETELGWIESIERETDLGRIEKIRETEQGWIENIER